MGSLVKIAQQYIPITVFVLGGFHLLRNIQKFGFDLFYSIKKKRMLDRWTKNCPKDIVVLHVFSPGTRIPNPGPYGLKLETFLRMKDIIYEIDTESPKGENDKSPWVTFNGKNYTDSQLIIDVLEKKFGKIVNTYDAQEYAVGTITRIMMEEHFYWGLILWRYVYCGGSHLNELFSLPTRELKSFKKMCKPKYELFTWYQGVGRHSKEQVIKLMSDDLRALSLILGNKTFLLGDEPCSDDCAVFGMLAQIIWAELDSPYAKLVEEELPNLQLYCNRIKERFWPDWEEILDKARCTS